MRNDEINIPYKDTFIQGTLFFHSSKTLIIISPGWLVTRSRKEVQEALKILSASGGPSLFIYDSLNYIHKNIFKKISPLYEDELSQLTSIINYFHKNHSFKNVLLEGISLGAMLSVVALNESKSIDGLITINGFFDIGDYLKNHLFIRKLSFSPFYIKRSYKNINFFKTRFYPEKIKVPTLVIHGSADTFLSPHTSTDFYHKLTIKDKQLESVEDADHYLSGDSMKTAWQIVLKWLKKHNFE